MPDTTAIPTHHLAIIAATVAAVCGERASILEIVPAGNAWGRSGRVAIHNSHRMPGRDGVRRLLARQDPGAKKK
ncbi:MAG: hypothetical protein ACM336_02970 [Acidobacteriota bacterium]